MSDNVKPMLLSRRRMLASGLAMAGAIPLLRMPWAAAAPEARGDGLRLTAGTRILDVYGKAARVFGLTGPDGKPGITLSPGERFRVDLVNEAGTPTLVHWHGQLPPWTQDGFPWPQTPPIASGASQSYDYAPIAGTYWMHSHVGMQEQDLMTAPLIVHSAADRGADRQEVVLMLHDFSFRTPEELLAGLTKSNGGQSAMANSGMGNGMKMGAGSVPAMNMASGMAMDLNDVDYDAFLANDRTFADPEMVRTELGGRVRLRLINGASSTQFWIDLGALTGSVIAVDGHPVRPLHASRLPIAMAQRLDVLIDLLAAVPIPSSRRSRASGRAPESSSGRPARRWHACPPKPNKMRRRSISRSSVASKRSSRWRRARLTSRTAWSSTAP
jgi:FtsP/CotA-like multicopper oxidase with cupredoxin domain